MNLRHRSITNSNSSNYGADCAHFNGVFNRRRDASGEAIARDVRRIEQDLDREAQHGPVKVYTPEEIAAFVAARVAV